MATRRKKTNPTPPPARGKLPLEAPPKYAAMVSTCKQQVGTIQQCGDYNNQPAVQAAATLVLADATALDKTLGDLANALALVASLEKQRNQQVGTLKQHHDTLEAQLNIASQGQAKALTAWGAKVATRTTLVASTDPPVNAAMKTTDTAGSIVMKCKADPSAVSYAYQTGPTQANPDTWPAPVIRGESNYTLTGLTVGQKLYGRIAVVRRGTGQGQWSSILEVTVR